jgi:hypothetical protein
MSSWSTVVALSGFLYDGPAAAVVALPRIPSQNFKCFWSTGTGWGRFSLRRQSGNTLFEIKVLMGTLSCRSCEIVAVGSAASVEIAGRALKNHVTLRGERLLVTLDETLRLGADDEIQIAVHA